MNELVKKQNILQEEARSVLYELGLIDFLSKFGEAKIVGSFALGLMTWRDIDIDLLVEKLDKDKYFEVIKFLFGNSEINRLVLADNRTLTEKLVSQGIPKSMYLGIYAKGENNTEWKIDLRFVESSLERADKYIEETKSKLNDENRKIILGIKSEVCSHQKYISKEISSVDVYGAVLDKGIKDIAGFEDYLAEKGIEL